MNIPELAYLDTQREEKTALDAKNAPGEKVDHIGCFFGYFLRT